MITAKEYLKQVRDIRVDIIICKKDMRRYKKYKQYIDVAQKQTQLKEQYKELVSKEQAVKATISKIKDNTLRQLLELYYITGCNWEQTAELIGKSYFHTVHRLHPQALAEIDILIKNKKF